MKLSEVKGFPKELLKKKELTFFRAFIITSDTQEMQVNIAADLYGITFEAAVNQMLNEMPKEQLVDLKGKEVSFALFTIDKKELEEKDLLDEGEVYFNNGVISLTLKGKLYKTDVTDMLITDIAFDIDEKTNVVTVTNLKLAKDKK